MRSDKELLDWFENRRRGRWYRVHEPGGISHNLGPGSAGDYEPTLRRAINRAMDAEERQKEKK